MGDPSVMTWCAIGLNRKWEVLVVNGRIKSKSNLEIIDEQLQNCGEWWFMSQQYNIIRLFIEATTPNNIYGIKIYVFI